MPSKLEAMYQFQCKAAGIVIPKIEYKFHPERRWRFDFAWPDQRIAVEIEGLSSKISRHQTIAGYRKDCEKYNAAALLGWRLLRFTDQEIKKGIALQQTEEILCQ